MTQTGGAVVVAMARRAERKLIETLNHHGATSPDRAVPLTPDRVMGRAALRRMIRGGAIREAGDRYWLDQAGAERFSRYRRIRALVAVGVVILLIAALVLGVRATRAQEVRPDQTEFRGLYEELIETNTTLSEGSCTLAAERMAARLIAAGYPEADVRVMWPEDRPKDGALAAVLHGSDAATTPLLLLAHIDVVEARREDWVRDPFTLVEEGGYFYARGAQDDKAQAAIWTDTMIRLKQQGFRPTRDIKLALTCGEETADTFNGVEWLLEHHPDVLRAGLALNEGARGRLDAAGNRIALEVQAGEKIYQDYALEVTNPGGHSSRPVPANAIVQLSRGLVRLGQYRFPSEINATTRAHFAAMAEVSTDPVQAADLRALAADDANPEAYERIMTDPGWNAMMHTTCVPTMVTAGHAPNALPQRARANVNCRILPGHTPQEVQADLERILEEEVIAVSIVGNIDPVSAAPPLSPEVMGPIRASAEKLWPGLPVVPTLQVGATDARFTNAAGIPTYGVTGLFTDPDGGGIHGLNERIRVRSLYEGRDFLFELVKMYSQ
ncbi:MAG: M20/M25/M40 family metallo-hydrolase [Brevundimonas sp.]|nr:MAG: M20/M25/M40 family metallo-hydrolase [Brevundimonas sp.]